MNIEQNWLVLGDAAELFRRQQLAKAGFPEGPPEGLPVLFLVRVTPKPATRI